MVLVTEVRLRSRKTPAHELGENRKEKKKRRLDGDEVEVEQGDSCMDLYKAARDQLKEEMKAAGMVGSLPLSFGGSSRSKISKTRKRSRQGREQLLDKEEADGGGSKTCFLERGQSDLGDEKGNVNDALDEKVIDRRYSPLLVTTVVDKVRVVYDSDGEVAERVVQQVEIVEDAKPLEQSVICNAKQNNTFHKAKKIRYPVPKDVVKFYVQRHTLFEKFDENIQLDHESWYSVTPQIIAEHIAKRLACDVVIDPFSGCGGNVIQLATTCKQVIAIDIDPEKIRMAKHNATIYGVANKIDFIVGNSIDLLPTLKADVVFLSPPWGGVKYRRKQFKLEDMLVSGVSGLDLFAQTRLVSKNIAYYLPRGTPPQDLDALAPGELVECERVFLNKQLKVLIAYYGNLARSESCDATLLDKETTGTISAQEQ